MLTADDFVEIQPRIEFRRRKLAHFFQEPQVSWIMVVVTHPFLPPLGFNLISESENRHRTGLPQDGRYAIVHM